MRDQSCLPAWRRPTAVIRLRPSGRVPSDGPDAPLGAARRGWRNRKVYTLAGAPVNGTRQPRRVSLRRHGPGRRPRARLPGEQAEDRRPAAGHGRRPRAPRDQRLLDGGDLRPAAGHRSLQVVANGQGGRGPQPRHERGPDARRCEPDRPILVEPAVAWPDARKRSASTTMGRADVTRRMEDARRLPPARRRVPRRAPQDRPDEPRHTRASRERRRGVRAPPRAACAGCFAGAPPPARPPRLMAQPDRPLRHGFRPSEVWSRDGSDVSSKGPALTPVVQRNRLERVRRGCAVGPNRYARGLIRVGARV